MVRDMQRSAICGPSIIMTFKFIKFGGNVVFGVFDGHIAVDHYYYYYYYDIGEWIVRWAEEPAVPKSHGAEL